jgi:hypothetical protein
MAEATHHAHGDHSAVQAEPDVRRVGTMVGWGIGLFVTVVVIIGLLTTYFWWERGRQEEPKVKDVSLVQEQMHAVHTREDAALHPTSKEPDKDGHYHIAIEKAMDLVVRDGM